MSETSILGHDRAWLIAERERTSREQQQQSIAEPPRDLETEARTQAAYAAWLFRAFQEQGFHAEHALDLTKAVLSREQGR